MAAIEDRYISLLTDFGFKRIFGTAPNKDLLINFLNCLFDGRKVIKDLKYNNSEHVGDIYTERKAIFDVYCESVDGEKFTVEMQNASQKYLKDRTIYYSTFPIREQAPKGEWDFKLNPVYTVALVNYDMKEKAFDQQEISHQVQLCDTATKQVFYDKLEFIYVEVTKFNKTENELVTLYDKWVYALKNLAKLTDRPAALRDKIFDRLFQVAEIAKFTPTELREYEDSLKAYRDLKNSLDTAEEKGEAKEKKSTIKRLLASGISVDIIAIATGLTHDEVKVLIDDISKE
ncbi:MAG: Rpn family recombination-promoting nuclease/putative transposase [Prevotella sp.]|nr:Rpn family recombination-promoting nuclease/putative transposase [Prevotella sp.]